MVKMPAKFTSLLEIFEISFEVRSNSQADSGVWRAEAAARRPPQAACGQEGTRPLRATALSWGGLALGHQKSSPLCLGERKRVEGGEDLRAVLLISIN